MFLTSERSFLQGIIFYGLHWKMKILQISFALLWKSKTNITLLGILSWWTWGLQIMRSWNSLMTFRGCHRESRETKRPSSLLEKKPRVALQNWRKKSLLSLFLYQSMKIKVQKVLLPGKYFGSKKRYESSGFFLSHTPVQW